MLKRDDFVIGFLIGLLIGCLGGVGIANAESPDLIGVKHLTATPHSQTWSSRQFTGNGTIYIHVYLRGRELEQELDGDGCGARYLAHGLIVRVRQTNCGHPGPSAMRFRYVSLGGPKPVLIRLTRALQAPALPGRPFGAEEFRLFGLAEAFWGGRPPQCTTIARRIVPARTMRAGDVVAEATEPPVGQRVPCRLLISDKLLARPREECIVMLHEVGHLFGERHSTDPASIMYPEITAASVPICEG